MTIMVMILLMMIMMPSRLQRIRETRDSAAVAEALSALEEAAKTGSGNLLELSVQAARVRCTVGEISGALEAAWGRHSASGGVVGGVYRQSREQHSGGGSSGTDFGDAVKAAGADGLALPLPLNPLNQPKFCSLTSCPVLQLVSFHPPSRGV